MLFPLFRKTSLFILLRCLPLLLLLNFPISTLGQPAFNCAYTASIESKPYQTIGVTGNGSFAWSPSTIWDNASSGNSIFFTGGFNFNFNGNIFTTCGYSANGYIWFGSGPAPGAGTPDVLSVPSLGANNFGVIAGFACDLGQHPSLAAFPIPPNGGFGPRLIQYNTFGSSPNRFVAIEFIGFYPKVNGCGGAPDHHRVDFQIRLYENNPAGIHPNRIEIQHRDQSAFCNDRPYSFQVGIRGVNPQDFLCRKQSSGNFTATSSSPGTANTDRINFLAGDHVATGSQVLVYDYNVKPQIFPNPIAVNTCPSGTVNLFSSIQTNIRWYKDNIPVPGPEGSGPTYTASMSGSYKVVIEDPVCPRASDPVDVTIVPCNATRPEVITNPVGTTVCKGSAVQFSVVANGQPPLSYRWRKNGIDIPGTNQPQLNIPVSDMADLGNYDVIVTNAGGSDTSAIASLNFFPENKPVISIAPPGLADLCNGPVTLQIDNGFSDISWSNGVQGQTSIEINTPGNYFVTAKDQNGCTTTATSISLINSPPPEITVTPPGPIFLCIGSVSLNGPAGFSDYVWSEGSTTVSIEVSLPGAYALSATASNGCRGESAPVEVFGGSSLPVFIGSSDSLICAEATATLTAGGSFSSYSWNNGASGASIEISSPGLYWVVATDQNGCEAFSDTLEIKQIPDPVAGFSYTQTTGYTIEFENTSSQDETWLWNFGNGNTSTLENPSFTFPFDDTYPVILISFNDCGSDTLLVNVEVKKFSSVEDLDLVSFKTGPNPAIDHFRVKMEMTRPKRVQWELYGENGQLIWSEITSGSHIDLGIPAWAELSPGLYLIRAVSGKSSITKKILKP
jgi:hypothetical protein